MTYGDSERSRSLTKILDAEYLANSPRQGLYQQKFIIKLHVDFLKKTEN